MHDPAIATVPAGQVRAVQFFRDPDPTDVMISIRGHGDCVLAEIRYNGTVTFDPTDVDDAAAIFWNAVARQGAELDELRQAAKSIETVADHNDALIRENDRLQARVAELEPIEQRVRSFATDRGDSAEGRWARYILGEPR